MLLIGSRAIDSILPFYRPCKDWDYLAYRDEIGRWIHLNKKNIEYGRTAESGRYYRVKLIKGPSIEFQIVDRDRITSSNALMDEYEGALRYLLVGNIEASIAGLSTLAGLKWAHLVRPIHWAKSIEDYHWLKKYTEFEPDEIFQLRRKEFEERSPTKVNLSSSNDMFFSKSAGYVKRIYKHDDLHRATCYGAQPIFERIKQNKDRAAVSKELFFQLSSSDRLNCVREECYAIALERKLIPSKFAVPSTEAYSYALQKICTTLTTGWFRDFAIENYEELKVPNVDYVSLFNQNIERVCHV